MTEEHLKILAASDIHGDQTIIRALVKKAEDENVDLVVLCGDLTLNEMTTDNIIGPFAEKKRKVLLIPGNHETVATADFMAEMYEPHAKNIHGYSVRYKEVGIFGAGGATNVGPQIPIPEGEMFDLLKKGFDKISYLKKKLMVTHIHPEGTQIEKFSQWVPGSSAVTKAVKQFQPDILICGHSHEAQGLEEKLGKTRVIDVGPHGKIINL